MTTSVLTTWADTQLASRLPSTVPAIHARAVYTLPRAPRHGAPRPQPGDDPGAPSPGLRQMVVLIAEDEATIAETLALIVEDAGYVAVVAYDGRTALALARQHRPHLIITDLMMPHLNGADLIAAVRREATAEGVEPPPVIAVTALSRARAAEANADVIVEKPFDLRNIEAAMRQLLPDDPQ